MQIEYLADYPRLIPELAALQHEQWGYLRPGESLAERTRRLEAACGHCDIPTVVVALKGDAMLGSAMLVAHDMETRLELTPWLAGVYVVAKHRGHGVGSALVQRVKSDAAALGVHRLHLYTPDAAEFYLRLGWAIDERCGYLGQEVTVMSKPLC